MILNDAKIAQKDLETIVKWCEENQLIFNAEKCNVMPFHRRESRIRFEYKIGQTALTRVSKVRDVDILFDDRLSFVKHTRFIAAVGSSQSHRICNQIIQEF